MCKLMISLLAAAALAVPAFATLSTAAPSAAQAAACAEWQLPMSTYTPPNGPTRKYINIFRRDGWRVDLTYTYGGDGYWRAGMVSRRSR